MNLAPILAAPAIIQLHIAAAFTAVLAGGIVMLMRKGVGHHKPLGWVFAIAMMIVATSSFWITRNNQFSWIHLLSILTFVTLPMAIIARRRGNIRAHRLGMVQLYASLAIAGAFTLLPGRILGEALLGFAR
ncbi:MAG: DUF2306 domain-containing protein [Bosea sp. (in: a-proteobacteria)]